ncbi:MAG: hypothetical protein ACOYNU_08460 [Bacteroidales bacterium]
MDSEVYEDILYDNRILRWSARILGTLEGALLLSLAYDQLFKGMIDRGLSALIPLIGGQYLLAVTLTIDFIGLLIAYWKEGLGGGISLASLIVLFIGWSDFHIIFILGMGLVSVPSILYVAYRLRIYLALKKAEQDQTKNR